MKKIIIPLAVIAVTCSYMNCYARPAEAMEVTTLSEYKQYNQDKTDFPDPDEPYKIWTENDFVFHVYEDYAFLYECKDRTVTSVVIPDKVAGVPVVGAVDEPFGFCRNLTSITVPDTFQYFDWFDFTCTTVTLLGSDEEPVPSVAEISVSETNPYYTVYDGLLYTKDMKTLVGCPPAMDMKRFYISPETERIGDYAFVHCTELETAVIPPTVKHINNNAFTACTNLVSVELPETITSISGDMFYLCESLSEVTFNGEIERIGYGAFNGCSSLTDFVIPETVTCIGSKAFENSGCIENENGVHYIQDWVVGSDSDIRTAKIKEGTKGIAEMSFFVRSELEYLDIPDSVKYVGDFLFSGLSSSVPSCVHYSCSYIGELTIAPAKTATDIYIYDPECEIFDSEKTIPAVYKYTVPEDVSDSSTDWTDFSDDKKITGDIVIHGY